MLTTGESEMTYVASPSYSEDHESRQANLSQCLDTARRRIDEISKASEPEKTTTLIASAVEAGWNVGEVRKYLSTANEAHEPTDITETHPRIDQVPSSLL
jgi:hypothetical protein